MRAYTVAYYYITSESTESFPFSFECSKELILHDKLLGSWIILGRFAAGLTEEMRRKKTRTLDLEAALNVVWKAARNGCKGSLCLQICTWHEYAL